MSVNGVLGITVVKMARCKTEIVKVQSKVCNKLYSRKPSLIYIYQRKTVIYGKYGINFSIEC
jgi:hypothetical protein